MKPARAAAWMAVAAWHGVLVVVLCPGQRDAASPPASPQAVRVLAVPLPERAVAPRPPLLPAVWPQQTLPAVAPVAPPAFDIEPAQPPAETAAPAALAAPAPVVAAAVPVEVAPTANTPPLQPARRAACEAAPHPRPLRERGIEGVVRLRVWVDELGRAGQVMLAGSSGWRLFDDAAMAQARRCPFHPAQRGSQPVGSWVEFPVRFALETSNG